MKLSPFPSKNAPKVRREPLRSMAELAAELGVTVVHITATMSHYPEHPKPQLVHRNDSNGRNSWYERRPFLAWWKQVLEKRA